MCQACCDLTKVEKSDVPNCLTIPASGSAVYTTKRDALVVPISQGHYGGSHITIVPNDSAQSSDADCRYRREGSASGFIPGRGEWRIYNGGASALKVTVLETYCGAAFAAFARSGYEVPTHSTPTLDATAVSTLVLAANRNRAYALIENPSSNSEDIFLAFGPAAAVNTGILLNPGGHYEMEGRNLWRGVINGILRSAVASQIALVTEGV